MHRIFVDKVRNPVLLLSVFILLSGCMSLEETPHFTTTTEGPTSTTTSTTTTTTMTTTTTTLPVLEYTELKECERLEGNERDDCFYDIAVERQDFTLCENIIDNLLRTVCIAAKKRDTGICDFIDDLQTRDKCYYGVAITKNDEKVCGGIGLQILKDTCYLRISRNKKNKKICGSIGFLTIQDICLSDCSIKETQSDMIGTVDREDYIEVSIEAERCEGLKVNQRIDSDYLSLLNQSTKEVGSEEELISYRFACKKPVEETYVRLKVGDEEIVKNAACRGFSPPEECSILFLANESLLDSRMTEEVYLTFLARDCREEEVSRYIKPMSLYFTHWVFNGILRENKSNRIKSDFEKITLYYECNGTYDGILVKTKIGSKEINNYVTCRIKPECSLRFLEDKSELESAVGGSVYLTVSARECKGEGVKYSAEPGWLSFENASADTIPSNLEELTVEYACKIPSDFLLYVSIEVGNEEVVRYARCVP